MIENHGHLPFASAMLNSLVSPSKRDGFLTQADGTFSELYNNPAVQAKGSAHLGCGVCLLSNA